MTSFLKWIGGGLGWAAGGPLGALLGFFLGSMIDGISVSSQQYSGTNDGTTPGYKPRTQPGDFTVSLLVLSAAVMKADNKVLRSELDFVKRFLVAQFGIQQAEQQLLMLRDILSRDVDVVAVSEQIKLYMDYSSRLQLLHYLFGIAGADGAYNTAEIDMATRIARLMGIRQADIDSVKAMFIKDTGSAYKILEITREATDEEVKKAYRKMALKYHPDRVTHLGEEVQKAANAKFQELNAAYESIKKERGMN
jgi:DnaJ like chaperone protein